MNLMEKYRARVGDSSRGTLNGGPPVEDFERMFKQALEEINSKYISGTIPYIRGTHPHLWQRLVEVENKLSEAWLAGWDDEFKKNLDEWIDLNHKAIEIFREKDFQGILF